MTPLKYSTADAEKGLGRLDFDLHELKKNTKFSMAHGGGLPVFKVQHATPAYLSGLRPMDIMTHCNGVDLRSMSAEEATGTIKQQVASVGTGTLVIDIIRQLQQPAPGSPGVNSDT